MIKLQSLRDHLLARVPGLQAEQLHTFIDGGHIRSTAAESLSFESAYTANAIVTDWGQSADPLIVEIIAWLRIHQPDLLLGREHLPDALTFEVDVLNHDSYDIGFKLRLTERVGVDTAADGTHTVTHYAEPTLEWLEVDGSMRHPDFYVDGVQLS